jgi:broad specificity phosphatase PhoE
MSRMAAQTFNAPIRRAVYLARHGTPDLTRTELVYHLVPGPPLTSLGAREAAALGRYLHERGVRRIWASPLERARRTAEVASRASGATLLIDDRLMEMQPGETHDDVRARAQPIWDLAISAPTGGGSQALITHGGVVTALLLFIGVSRAIVDEAGGRFDSGNPLPPAGAWEVVGPGVNGRLDATLSFVPPAHGDGPAI